MNKSNMYVGNIAGYENITRNYADITSQYDLIYNKLGDAHRKRIQEYRLYWQFYEGRHWDNKDQNFGVDPSQQTLNFCKRIVDIKSQFLIKDGFNIIVPEMRDKAGTIEQDDRDFIKAALDEQWNKNDRVTTGLNMCQQGGVTGDVFVKVMWVPGDEAEYGYVGVDVVPSVWCFPEWDVTTKSRMISMTVAFPIEVQKERKKGLSRILNRQTEFYTDVVLHREYWTKEFYEIYEGDELVDRGPNVLGHIPFVHIQNKPNSNGRYGISELKDILSLQRQLNEKSTDISDIIDYQGSPQTWVAGAKGSDNLERRPDKIWALPENAKVGALEIQSDLKASLEWWDRIKKTMFDLSSVPDQIVNPTQNISNTPGVALHLAYMPIIEDRVLRMQVYGRGFVEINKLILEWLELLDPEFAVQFTKLPERTRYNTVIDFADPLPRDETLQIQNDIQRLGMGLTSRKRVLMRQQGIGEAEAEKLILEADEDTKARLVATTIPEATNKDAFGKIRTPDPVVQGDRISNNASQ